MIDMAGSEATYAAARRFLDAGLRHDDSLFTPGRAIWAAEPVAELFHRFVEDWNAGPDFLTRFEEQLAGARPETIQLAAEVLFVHALVDTGTGGATKRHRITTVLSWLPTPLSIPRDLDEALDAGIAAIGAAKAHLSHQVRYLVTFVRELKSLDLERQAMLLGDPWRFKSFAKSLPMHGAGTQVEALLHLAFPETFEPIVSIDVKEKIVEAFKGIAHDEDDVDARLQAIRSRLTARLEPGFSFYEPLVLSVWSGQTPEWAELLSWCRRLFAEAGFDAAERDYKLRIAERLASVREAFAEDDEGWRSLLRAAFTHRDNNLTDYREHLPFLDFVESGDQAIVASLGVLWDDAVPTSDGIRALLESLPKDVSSGKTARCALASFLSLARGAEENPFVRLTPFATAERVLGRSSTDPEDPSVRYDEAVELLDELVLRAWGMDIGLRDRLDAQGLVWWVASADPPEDWSAAERAAFLRYRGRAKELSRQPSELPEKAWLVRGANVDGLNLVPEWLTNGYVSIGWPAAGEIADGSSMQQIFELARERYPDDPPGRLRVSTGVLHSFVSRMKPGDLVVTVDGDHVYVGRLRGDLEWNSEGFAEACRRRGAEWLNSDAPVSRDSLRSRFPGLHARLRAWQTVTDLSSELTAITELAGITPPGQEVSEDVTLPPITEELAASLHLPRDWLQRDVLDLLAEKRQMIFYGPPGTGKTLVAQRLAEYLVSNGGEYVLIQFHPSYCYEDFFEGYRPVAVEGGVGVSYELTPGPLRRIAEAAAADPAHPYVLIIDEINRGNIPKIFGELLFLLEYRDAEIPLQYSPQTVFGLPRNLFMIGTMNTADRSIALVDAALRRRFYFVPFLPREEPVSLVLERWLDRNHHDHEPARLLRALNERIEKDEIAIGPSYLITGDGSFPDVERVWRHAILPVLEEHYYGTGQDVVALFGLEELRRGLTEAPVTSTVASPDEQAAESGAEPELTQESRND